MKTEKQKKSNFPPKSYNKNRQIDKKNNPKGKQKRKPSTQQVFYVVNPQKLKALTTKKAAEEKRLRIQEEREKRSKEIEQKKKAKIERNKQLSQKTKRGQPVMKNQIEFLLNKIQAKISQE